MTSYSGSVAYLKYVSKTDKGGVKVGDEFNSVFGLGAMDEKRMNFSAQAVVEALTVGQTKVIWTPVITDSFKAYDSAGVVVEGVTCAEDGTIDFGGKTNVVKVAYKYSQEYTPAKDIPTIGPKMERIPLVAEPRRIAVKYDQITAFQAKTDYGFSLDKQIAEQACGELAY